MTESNRTVSVDRLIVEYELDSGDTLGAVDNITLKVPQGKRLAIVGPSGCGKSTLLRAMAGILMPVSGSILYGNLKPGEAREKRVFGLVPQKPALLRWRTTFQNIALPMQLGNRRAEEITGRVQEMLNLFGLRDFADFRPDNLSGGMQSRTAIARALVDKPNVLLLDECFGSLDELTRERLYTELSPMWHKLGTSVILVTHSITEAAYLADEIVVFSDLPASIAGRVTVDADQPRKPDFRNSNDFLHATRKIRHLLKL